MTYLELYEKATRLIDNGEITIGEYEEMIKPIKREICEWIPASERLPSESGRYLVTHPLFTRKDKWLNIMYFGKPSMPNIKVKGKCWYMSDDEYGDVVYDDILAWMPLPKPWKDGEEE